MKKKTCYIVCSVLISSVGLLFVSQISFADKMRTVLTTIQSFNQSVDGELGFDPSVNGPVLYHEGAWRTFTPISNAKFPDFTVDTGQVTISGESHVVLNDGEVLFSGHSPLPISFANMTGIQVGWNALFAIPDSSTPGHFQVINSTNFVQPSNASASIISQKQYRYIGSFLMQSTTVGVPLKKQGNRYFYSKSEDVSGDSTGFGGSANHHFAGTAPLALIITASGQLTTRDVGGGTQQGSLSYNLFSPSSFYVFKLSSAATQYPFDNLDIPTAANQSSFDLIYVGTLTNLRVVGHIEDPVLFMN